jgi:hypothetical protein
LINTQSHRAAVRAPAASLMDDDGNVELRIRLIRPMSRETISVERFEHSHWRKAVGEEFAELWEAECAAVPEFSDSAFHIITGLLLPVWDRLPAGNMRVYRFETDDGERVIGRLVTPEALEPLYRSFGVDHAPALSPHDAWSAVLDHGATLDLAGDLQPARTSASASTTCLNPAGAPMRRSRASGAPTAPTRSSRRCVPAGRDRRQGQEALSQGECYMDADQLAATLGKKPTGGHWNSGIAVLRNNGLIETDGRRYRTAALFRAEIPERTS